MTDDTTPGDPPADPPLGERIATGRTAEVYALADHPDRVCKRFLDPEADAGAEAERTALAADAGAPAPAVFGVVAVDGHPGIVLERVDGPTMLAAIRDRPWRLPALAVRLADLQAAVHARRCPGLPSTTDRLARRIRRVDLPGTVRERVLDHLGELPDARRLCHGDFHPDNVVLTDDGPRLIDWVDASAGPPAADVARTLLLLSLATTDGGPISGTAFRAIRGTLRAVYLRRYVRATAVDRPAIRRWLVPVAAARLDESVPGERRRLRAYLDRGVRRPDDPGLP